MVSPRSIQFYNELYLLSLCFSLLCSPTLALRIGNALPGFSAEYTLLPGFGECFRGFALR